MFIAKTKRYGDDGEMKEVVQVATGSNLDAALANARMLAAFYTRKRENDIVLSKHNVLSQGKKQKPDGTLESFITVEATYRVKL